MQLGLDIVVIRIEIVSRLYCSGSGPIEISCLVYCVILAYYKETILAFCAHSSLLSDGKFEERNKEKAEKALMKNESRNVKGKIPGKQEGESKSVISRQNLTEEQNNDKELLDLFKITLTPVEAKKVSVGYLIKNNI